MEIPKLAEGTWWGAGGAVAGGVILKVISYWISRSEKKLDDVGMLRSEHTKIRQELWRELDVLRARMVILEKELKVAQNEHLRDREFLTTLLLQISECTVKSTECPVMQYVTKNKPVD